MAIIFCDGFDHYATADLLKKWTAQVIGNSCSITIDNAVKRTGTGSLRIYALQTGTVRHSAYIQKNLGANFSTLIVGCGLKVNNISTAYNWINFLLGTTLQVSVRLNGSGLIGIYRNTTLLATTPSAFSANGEQVYIEIKVVVHDTLGSVQIKKNGLDWYTLANVDTNNSGGAVNTIEFGCYSDWDSATMNVDDLYVDDADFLGEIRIDTIFPAGAGATTQWDPLSGANYENVDETTPDYDTTYVSSNTVSDIDTYTFGNMAVPGTIKGIQVNILGRKDDAGSRDIATVVRPAGTDRIGTTIPLGDDYVYKTAVYATNPDTSAAWTMAEVNGAEFGIKLIR